MMINGTKREWKLQARVAIFLILQIVTFAARELQENLGWRTLLLILFCPFYEKVKVKCSGF